ncbi:hypothetical protein ACHAXA_001344 [Cyclostephanos tholiformis]|uniref:Uncharacterized protein n=1 Tax=Cyclostephanos tholiformis TaxID=382380 RepID=A0ABD3R7H6_9STRA
MAVMAIRRRSLGVLIPCILLLHAGAFEARRSAAFAFSVVRNTRGGMIGGDFMTRGSTSAAAASDDDDDDDHEHYDDDDDDEDDDAVSTPSPRYFDLSGKTALITGSSGGIGKSIACYLSKE